jgi:hypothetical protein
MQDIDLTDINAMKSLLLFAAQWLYLHKTTQAKSWGLERPNRISRNYYYRVVFGNNYFLLLKIKTALKIC